MSESAISSFLLLAAAGWLVGWTLVDLVADRELEGSACAFNYDTVTYKNSRLNMFKKECPKMDLKEWPKVDITHGTHG